MDAFDGLDLATVAPAAPSSDLNASFTGSAVLASGGPDARFTLRLDSSSLGRETIGGGELRLRYAQQRAVLEGDVTLGAGRARVTLEAWPAARPIRYAVRQARFEDVDVGALMGAATFSTRLSGQLQGSGDGLDPATLRSDLTLTLDSSRINRTRVESATLSLSSASGRFRGDANVALGGGTIDATGSLLWSDVPSWEATGAADLRSLGALLGDTTTGALAARFDAGGSGLSLRTADAHARVSLETASWRTVHADSGRIDLRVRNGAVRVDSLWARTNVASIEGGGRLPLDPPAANRADTADFHLIARLESLQPVDSALPSVALSAGDGRAELRVTGTADSLGLRGTAHVGALLVGTTRLVGLDADANAGYSLAGGLRSGSLEVLLDRLAFPTATVTRTQLTATLDSGDVRLHAEARVDARRTAELDARFVTADARPAVIVERAEFQVDQDRWTLPEPARIRYGAGVDIENFVMEAADQRIALAAVWGDAGLTSLHADIDSLRVETLADLAGFDRVRGRLSTRVDLDGAAGARTGDASLDFAMRSADGGGGDIHATARIAGDSAAIDGTVTQDGRPDLRVEGSVPLGTGSAAALDLRARADSFRVNLLTPVLDPDLVRGLAGTLDGDVRITGTAADPQLDGSLTLADGRAHLTTLGVTYRLEGRADLSGNAAHLVDLRIGSGGGDLLVNGDVALESATVGTWDLAVRMDGFRAVDNDFVRATVSGDLKVNGTLTRPNVTGTVSVERGDLYLDSGLAAANVQDVTLTEADYAELEDYFGFPVRRNTQSTAPGFEALALDLSIELGRDSWLRQGANPELTVQLTGQLNVRKDPGPDLQLLGELDAIPEHSYVQQFGRRFQLSQGHSRVPGRSAEHAARPPGPLRSTVAQRQPARSDDHARAPGPGRRPARDARLRARDGQLRHRLVHRDRTARVPVALDGRRTGRGRGGARGRTRAWPGRVTDRVVRRRTRRPRRRRDPAPGPRERHAHCRPLRLALALRRLPAAARQQPGRHRQRYQRADARRDRAPGMALAAAQLPERWRGAAVLPEGASWVLNGSPGSRSSCSHARRHCRPGSKPRRPAPCRCS